MRDLGADSDDEQSGDLCAICDQTNQTLRLCAKCRRDPVNADWRDRSRREKLVDPSTLPFQAGLAALGRRLRPVNERTRQILGLLREHTICVPMRNFGVGRAHERWVWRSRPLNLSEIAFLVGCSRQAVLKACNKMIALRA